MADQRKPQRPRSRPTPRPGLVLRSILAICLAGWVALAAYLFFTPEPDELTREIDPVLGHALVFAAIAATALALVGPRRRWGPAGVIVAGIVGGIAVEVSQELADSPRGFQLVDIAADIVGVAVGVTIVVLADRILRRPRLVAGLVAIGSSTLLLAITTVAVIGPDELRELRACRGVPELTADRTLLRIDPQTVVVPGDGDGTATLEDQLAPRRAGDGYRFPGPAAVGLDDTRHLLCALRRADGFALTARLLDVAPDQRGPARIVTLSTGTALADIDLQLGVDGDTFSLRIREGPWWVHQWSLPGLHAGPVAVEVHYLDGLLTVRVDGQLVHEERVDPDLGSWSYQRALTIGDEHTGDRPLTATITDLEIRALVSPVAG
jgi:VanZ family protein